VTDKGDAAGATRTRLTVAGVAVVAVAVAMGLTTLIGGPEPTGDRGTGAAADYGEVLRAVTEAAAVEERVGRLRAGWGGEAFFASEGETDGGGAMPLDQDSASLAAALPDAAHEGDVVETDGEFAYVLSAGNPVGPEEAGQAPVGVSIYSAAGAASAAVAWIDLAADAEPSFAAPSGGQLVYWAQELMIRGETLVAVLEVHDWGAGWPWEAPSTDESMTLVLVYSVADRTAPVLVEQFSQSGRYTSSRLLGDVFYLVGSHQVAEAVEGDPSTYVPCFFEGHQGGPAKPTEVVLIPGVAGANYAALSAIDLAKAELVGELAVLGGVDAIHMSQENLYLAGTRYSGFAANPVIDLLLGADPPETTSSLVKVGLGAGKLEEEATADLSGALVSQFALDEFEGYLRVVVTARDPDAAPGAQDRSVGLQVLDTDLATIGSAPELAEGEAVQSVWFAGPVGYVATYSKTDPLATLDLSEPRAPRVASRLDVPGFATYLDPWGDGRLLGLAPDTGPDGEWLFRLKLSMFDVSTPHAVTEQVTASVDRMESWTLNNHKAVAVDSEAGQIGFLGMPLDQTNTHTDEMPVVFLVYSLDQTEGFVKRGEFEAPPGTYAWDEQVRGWIRDGTVYVGSAAGLAAYSLADGASLTLVATPAPGLDLTGSDG
jgi:hypothetical protein